MNCIKHLVSRPKVTGMNQEQIEPRPVHVVQFIFLTSNLHDLLNCSPEHSLEPDESQQRGVIEQLEGLEDHFGRLGLKRAASRTNFKLAKQGLLQKLQRRVEEGQKNTGEKYANQIKQIIQEIFDTALNEAKDAFVFPALPVNNYEIRDFIDALEAPNMLWGIDTNVNPPLPAIFEPLLKEATRCLMVGFTTAAILFSCQATEVIVRYYYEQFTGQSPARADGTPWHWGKVNHEFEKSAVPSHLLKKSKKIVDQYRNPAMHANRSFNSGEEVKVWEECRNFVDDMLIDLLNKQLIKST